MRLTEISESMEKMIKSEVTDFLILKIKGNEKLKKCK